MKKIPVLVMTIGCMFQLQMASAQPVADIEAGNTNDIDKAILRLAPRDELKTDHVNVRAMVTNKEKEALVHQPIRHKKIRI